jgi:hypothetical protein
VETIELRRWSGVALALEADPDKQNVRLVFLFDDEPTRAWAAEAVLQNVGMCLNRDYYRRVTPAPLAHAEKLRAWIEHTRVVARDVRMAYGASGEQIADLMEQAARETEGIDRWFDQMFEGPPKDAAGRANLLITAQLWTHDRVRNALEDLCARPAPGVPARGPGRTTLLEPADAALAAAGVTTGRGLRVTSDEALRVRVDRLRVRPANADHLVAHVLGASRRGPFDPHGADTTSNKHP